jgi:hypothetical protein
MYLVSRQWTLWRILSHDLHHGGQLALLLGLQASASRIWATGATISPNCPWPIQYEVDAPHCPPKARLYRQASNENERAH